MLFVANILKLFSNTSFSKSIDPNVISHFTWIFILFSHRPKHHYIGNTTLIFLQRAYRSNLFCCLLINFKKFFYTDNCKIRREFPISKFCDGLLIKYRYTCFAHEVHKRSFLVFLYYHWGTVMRSSSPYTINNR